jgi:hypothetical protein
MPSFIVFTKIDGCKVMIARNTIVAFEDKTDHSVVYVVTNQGSGAYKIKEDIDMIMQSMNNAPGVKVT